MTESGVRHAGATMEKSMLTTLMVQLRVDLHQNEAEPTKVAGAPVTKVKEARRRITVMMREARVEAQ